MPSVKQPIFAGAVILAAAGCTELELARFAPPGLIKYEDLAGDQPVNPAIEARIQNRNIDADAQYPVLARTPGEDDRPTLRPAAERTAQMDELVSMREQLQVAADLDRAAVEAEKPDSELLPEHRDALKEKTELDAAAAKRERKELTPPDGMRPD